ncbi:hypothetical protein B4114_2788 [Geobacillus stearothermophilus]|uniref:Uncharacterized protein n=1 Tax=Geobacillus stearothermophilus TaxID=1422 RepID=A0A150ND58_GEOSE|nr:hypothetical protein B4114_2788 [Geobacillus stearothermophilus]
MSTFLSFPGMKMMRLGTRIFMKKFRGRRFALPPGHEHAPSRRVPFHENSVGFVPRCPLLTSSCQRNHSVMSISSPGT